MPRYQITRHLGGFDTAHRLMKHEGKCRNYHGHCYKMDITCSMSSLDDVGRVIDFSVVKARVGSWLDHHFDHGMILQEGDPMIAFLQSMGDNHKPSSLRLVENRIVSVTSELPSTAGYFQEFPKLFVVGFPPTSELLSEFVWKKASELLQDTGVSVDRVRLYETENCWSDYPPNNG